MIIRAIDSDGDWIFGRGISSYKKKDEAIKENVLTRLREWKEDCFFATANGVDYNNLLDYGTKSLLDADILRIVTQSEGVLQITSYESTIDTDRGYTGVMQIQTIYSTNISLEV